MLLCSLSTGSATLHPWHASVAASELFLRVMLWARRCCVMRSALLSLLSGYLDFSYFNPTPKKCPLLASMKEETGCEL